MFCSKCGVENPGEAKCCKGCGNALELQSTVQVPPPESNHIYFEQNTTQQKNVLKYGLAPVGIFLMVLIFYGIISIITNGLGISATTSPFISGVLSFIDAVVIPVILSLAVLAIPIGIIYAVYSNSQSFDGTIKCGNCGYTGYGKNGRSTIAQVFAWLALFIFWPITLIYYATTSKYVCPKCNSTYIGLRNKEGVYCAPVKSTGVVIVLIVIISIIIIGILSATVLAIFGTEPSPGSDASIKAHLSTMRSEADIYHMSNDSYSGVCNSSTFKDLTKTINQSTMQKYICNDNDSAYAASIPLSTGNYFCIDSNGAATGTLSALGIKDSCLIR